MRDPLLKIPAKKGDYSRTGRNVNFPSNVSGGERKAPEKRPGVDIP
jgi:hypothetical protein